MIDGKSHSMYRNRHDYLLSTEVYISMLLSKLLVGDIDMVSDDFSDVISPIIRGEQICDKFFSSAHDQIPTHKNVMLISLILLWPVISKIYGRLPTKGYEN